MVQIIEVGSPAFKELVAATIKEGVEIGFKAAESKLSSWNWISKDEAMKLLDCGQTKLHSLVSTGEIGISQATEGGTPLYSKLSIDAYLRKHYRPGKYEQPSKSKLR